jgi:hypothetical protein
MGFCWYADGGLIPQLSGRLYLDCGRTRRRLRRVGLALNRSVCWPQRFGPPFSIWLLSSFISLCKFFFGRVYSLLSLVPWPGLVRCNTQPQDERLPVIYHSSSRVRPFCVMLPLHRSLSSLSSHIFILFRPCLLHISLVPRPGLVCCSTQPQDERYQTDVTVFRRSIWSTLFLHHSTPPSSHSIVSLFLYFPKSPYTACGYLIFPFPSPVQWCTRYFMFFWLQIYG